MEDPGVLSGLVCDGCARPIRIMTRYGRTLAGLYHPNF
jgi:hypothetical protein